MTQRIAVNQKVSITALYFPNKKNFTKTFPKRMEYNGATYTFLEGLQCLVKKGQQITHIFTMTDGSANYRLSCDSAQFDWTLEAITQTV